MDTRRSTPRWGSVNIVSKLSTLSTISTLQVGEAVTRHNNFSSFGSYRSGDPAPYATTTLAMGGKMRTLVSLLRHTAAS